MFDFDVRDRGKEFTRDGRRVRNAWEGFWREDDDQAEKARRRSLERDREDELGFRNAIARRAANA